MALFFVAAQCGQFSIDLSHRKLDRRLALDGKRRLGKLQPDGRVLEGVAVELTRSSTSAASAVCHWRGREGLARGATYYVANRYPLLLTVNGQPAVVFTLNASDAINMAIGGMLADGDHVVTTNMEHSAVSRPLTHLQMRGRIALTRVEMSGDGRIDPETIAKAIGHRTRLVVVNHGCGTLGILQPIEEMARISRAKGCTLVVDASHSAGIAPIDVDGWGIGALAASGHTGLLGPAGTGILALGEGIRVRPARTGETGAGNELTTQPIELPWALEAGTPNLPGLAGLWAGLRYVRSQSVDRLREHQTTLIKRFIGAIGLDERFKLHAARGDLPRTGTVSFSLKGVEPARIATELAESRGIVMAAGLHGAPDVHRALGTFPAGTVRVSVGCFNREDEIDRAVAALRELADAGTGAAARRVGLRRGEVAGAS